MVLTLEEFIKLNYQSQDFLNEDSFSLNELGTLSAKGRNSNSWAYSSPKKFKTSNIVMWKGLEYLVDNSGNCLKLILL